MKKPNNLTLADLLRFTTEDRRKHDTKVAKYREFVLTSLIKEVGSSEPFEIIFHLGEKYHPTLKVKHKRGAKTKWGDYLNAMIAVEVQYHRDSGLLLKEAIWKVSEENRWKVLLKNTSDKGLALIDKAYKNGKKLDSYSLALKCFKLNNLGDPLFNWDETASKMVKRALNKD